MQDILDRFRHFRDSIRRARNRAVRNLTGDHGNRRREHADYDDADCGER